ncbi:FAD-binding oxidoreductase [Streptomyces sp. NBC_00322]|uniref:FAD-binding oxidoreductase n=1 Tax=Streptomyces sp. NBC_00322 TaxID=2975712 RepID=UPI002E2E2667|nr:FAD-binding oxidoreductase [Streptomyces sp. NBC_00322]
MITGIWCEERNAAMVVRRDVLRMGSVAAALGLAAGLTGGAGKAAGQQRFPRGAARPEPRAWRELRRRLSPAAGLYRPGSDDYSLLALPDNLRYADVLPAGIVACATERDVQVAVRWAAWHGVPFAPRSGGHNYAGYSTTRGLLISLRRMNDVAVLGTRLALGGGTTNSDVYAARAANLYFPGGRCPGVGVAGLTLGGGLGFNDRKWGLTCDRLVETRLVLADGSLVRAADDENPDLFWACRGGAGGNFGINTAFVFDATPVGELLATVFDLTFDLKAGVPLVAAVQEILDADAAGDFDVRIGFKHPGDGPAAVALLGQRLGDEAALRGLLAPVLELGPTKEFIEQRHFWTAQDYLMEKPGAGGATASKSLVPDRWLNPGTVESVAEWVRGWRPGVVGNTGYVTLFAMGGRSGSPGPGETAYPHRDATFVIDVGTHWKPTTPQEIVDDLLIQTRAMHRTLRRDLETSAAYVNFPDPDLRKWQWAYYGGNYDRLVDVKHRYDPSGLFHYDQAVGM